MLSIFQKKIVSYSITALAIFVLGAFVVFMFKLFGMFLNEFYYVLFPVALAVMLSYIVEPAVDYMSDKLKLGKVAACNFCFVSMLIFVLTILFFGIPYLIAQVSDMIANFPAFSDRIGEYMSEHAPHMKEKIVEKLEAARTAFWGNNMPKGDGKAISKIVTVTKFASEEITIFVSFIAAMAVVPVYLYYILISEFDFFQWLHNRISFLPKSTRENVVFFVRRFSEIMQSFFRGQLLIASIMGLMLGVGLKIAGVKFGFLLGLFAGLLNIIPYFGTIIGLGVILPVSFFQVDGGAILSAISLSIFVVVQLIEGYYLTPKIMGDKTGLHPTVIIFSVFFWGTALDGILGMILAIPFSAFVVALYPKIHEMLSDWLARRE